MPDNWGRSVSTHSTGWLELVFFHHSPAGCCKPLDRTRWAVLSRQLHHGATRIDRLFGHQRSLTHENRADTNGQLSIPFECPSYSTVAFGALRLAPILCPAQSAVNASAGSVNGSPAAAVSSPSSELPTPRYSGHSAGRAGRRCSTQLRSPRSCSGRPRAPLHPRSGSQQGRS